jgi:acetolactate synthase I/II/III large subunit
MEITGAQAVMKSLEALGVDTVFGYPGGAILPAYDPLIDAGFEHVLVRHEQGAIHMAEGYAHATGRVGVCIVTSGPAATNLVTGLADATWTRSRSWRSPGRSRRPRSARTPSRRRT